MKHFYVESYGYWMIVYSRTKRLAKSEGVKEFGRGKVKAVRVASKDEVNEFIQIKGADAIVELK